MWNEEVDINSWIYNQSKSLNRTIEWLNDWLKLPYEKIAEKLKSIW